MKTDNSKNKMLSVMSILADSAIAGAALSEIAKGAGMAPSTTLQYIEGLLEFGWAEKQLNGWYRLSVRFYSTFAVGIKASEVKSLEDLAARMAEIRGAVRG